MLQEMQLRLAHSSLLSLMRSRHGLAANPGILPCIAQLKHHAAHRAAGKPRTMKRPPLKEPDRWERAIKPKPSSDDPLSASGPLQDDDLVKEISKYGDLCEVTYNNFLNNSKTLTTFLKDKENSEDDAFKERKKSDTLEPYAVGGFMWMPNELMRRPAGCRPGELKVAKGELPRWQDARDYKLGIADKLGIVDDDPTFFLIATSGVYRGELKEIFKDAVSTNWIGYVAIDNPGRHEKRKRDIVVAFRGTSEKTEWLSNAAFSMTRWVGSKAVPPQKRATRLFKSFKRLPGEVAAHSTKNAPVSDLVSNTLVMRGYENMYRNFSMTPGNTLSLQGQVHVAVRMLLARYGDEVGSITTTGHSLGGGLAALCAFDLVASGINHLGNRHTDPHLVPVTAITFEAPRVGNLAFKEFFDSDDGPRQLRITNAPDVVPKVPYLAWSEGGIGIFGYVLASMLLVFTYLGEVFGHSAGKEHSMSHLGYHHAGTEYRINNSELASGKDAGRLVSFLRNWFPLLPADCSDISRWHNLQRVLCTIDTSRHVWGPDGVPDNENTPSSKHTKCTHCGRS